MRLFFLITFFLLSVLLYPVSAGSDLLTLRSEASGFADVRAWIQSADGGQIPLPAGHADIGMEPSILNHTKENFFYIASDLGFGFSHITRKGMDSILKVSWYLNDGKPAGQWQKSWPDDIPLPALRIDPDTGNLIAVDLTNHVRLINKNGLTIKDFTLLDTLHIHTENNAYIDYNGGLLAAGITEVNPGLASHPDYRTSIQVFTLDDKVIWYKSFPGWRIRSVNSSADGQFVAASFYRKETDQEKYLFRSMVFNAVGKVICDQPLRARQTLFNKKNNRVFFRDKSAGYLIDLTTGKQIAQIQSTDQDRLFLTAVFMSPSEYLAVQEGIAIRRPAENLSGWVYTQISIRAVDESGNEAALLPIDDIEVIKPVLTYDESLYDLFVGHRSGWRIYHLNLDD